MIYTPRVAEISLRRYLKSFPVIGLTGPRQSGKSTKGWLSILEASYIIFMVSPYYDNFGKRIIKSQKVYFYDTGIIRQIKSKLI